jgi:pre-mRNA-splicing helicase BRR2
MRLGTTRGAGGFGSVLAATEDFEGLTYRPTTKESRVVYEMVLSFVHQFLGDQPQDVLRGTADEVLAVLKTDGAKDVERKRQIDQLLSTLTSEQYAQLVNLGKKITDYRAAGDKGASTGGAADNAIDEDMGVAVVFDEEEEEEDGDNYEVKGESDEVRTWPHSSRRTGGRAPIDRRTVTKQGGAHPPQRHMH